MFWLRRPPYVRWLTAALLIGAAAYVDLANPPTQAHPYLGHAVAAGEHIDEATLEWRQIPVGVLPVVDLDETTATRDLTAGVPLLPGDLSARPPIPEDWWAVPLELPGTPGPGTAVRIVVADTATTVDGVIVAVGADDPFSPSHSGLVAVPAASAATVATASLDRRLVVLLAP